ncbi:MAG TPA: hypothetical protein VGD53_22615 [Actinoallomurus sp.]|jgi:hypothetical protein
MVVHRVDGAAGADVEGAAERQSDDRPTPADSLETEDGLSRADSRIGALAANEKPVPQPYAKRLDTPIADEQPTPREVLDGFAPAKAGLPEVTEEEAADYIAQNVDDRPWLGLAKGCDPPVQRILVALDQGQGHALERHEGFADDDKLQRRVTALEDPAQLDPEKRAAGIDGCKPGNKDHACGDTATAIQDPDAFAVIFARGVEHPDVQRALRTPFDPKKVPQGVSLTIEDLLGADAHRYCSGYRLEPVGGSKEAGQDCRSAWVEAKRRPDREPDVPDPRCAPIESFEGATVKYFFRPNRDRDGYEIATMYVEPTRKSGETR